MNDLHLLQENVNRLQESVAFQQRTIDDLNQVILEMRAQLDRVSQQVQRQNSRIEWLSTQADSGLDPDEKPPHY